MQVHDGLGLRARGEERVPARVVDAREPEPFRVLREAHGAEPARGVVTDLGGRDLGIAQPRQLARDEARPIGRAPLVDHPVVVRPQRRESQRSILHAREAAAGEAPERRAEAQRCPDARDVHVGEARGRLAHRGPELLVRATRRTLPLLEHAPGRAVREEDRHALVLEDPPGHAFVVGLDVRAIGRVRGGHAPDERVWWLQHVVVDRHDRAEQLVGLRVGDERDRRRALLVIGELGEIAATRARRFPAHASSSTRGSSWISWRAIASNRPGYPRRSMPRASRCDASGGMGEAPPTASTCHAMRDRHSRLIQRG